MQDLGEGPLGAVGYDVIELSQPCYDLFDEDVLPKQPEWDSSATLFRR